MSDIHFWINGEVVSVNKAGSKHEDDYIDYLSVDTAYAMPSFRYGYFTDTTFVSVPYDEFPSEFRMALLLMGIT